MDKQGLIKHLENVIALLKEDETFEGRVWYERAGGGTYRVDSFIRAGGSAIIVDATTSDCDGCPFQIGAYSDDDPLRCTKGHWHGIPMNIRKCDDKSPAEGKG